MGFNVEFHSFSMSRSTSISKLSWQKFEMLTSTWVSMLKKVSLHLDVKINIDFKVEWADIRNVNINIDLTVKLHSISMPRSTLISS
jgi:hypothetical protein